MGIPTSERATACSALVARRRYVFEVPDSYTPRMSPERVKLLRTWHEHAYEIQKAKLPMDMSFMGLELHIAHDVFAPDTDKTTEGDPFHRAVDAEVSAGERVLDMGTGSGVSALLAARRGAEVVAVDINPRA